MNSGEESALHKKGAMDYSSIPSTDDDDKKLNSSTRRHDEDGRDRQQRKRSGSYWISLILVIAAIAAIAMRYRGNSVLSPSPKSSFSFLHAFDENQALPMPRGVNIASWLSLEDYFYVGDHAAVEVATPTDGTMAGVCLPPLHTGPETGPAWNSETDLLSNLRKASSLKQALRTFHAFRVSYLDFDHDLPQMVKLGIRRVRVPISWCATDRDPSHDELFLREGDANADEEAELEKRFTCLDPFFAAHGEHVLWPAISRPFLAAFLRACAKYGIKATLDIHTYPGGTSLGTFSGVWPRKPLFWLFDDPAEPHDADIGRSIYRDWLSWLESLAKMDPEAFAGVGALSAMNEPAHLAGLFGPGSYNPDITSYVPLLPQHVTEKYTKELLGAAPAIPDGPHLRVLLWQKDAVEAFRKSSLPGAGVELHINVHESVFTTAAVQTVDPDGHHNGAVHLLTSWWRNTTTVEERKTWAVLDIHHYHAWEAKCQGAVDATAHYTCGDATATDAVLEDCAGWADMFRSCMNGETSAKLTSGEFSTSTHHAVLRSCLDTTTLRKSYLSQVEAAQNANIDLYYWSWKMPYGGAFRPAWSFKHLLYRLGVDGFATPDTSEIPCGP